MKGVDGGRPVVGMYCMKEDSLFNLQKEKKKLPLKITEISFYSSKNHKDQ